MILYDYPFNERIRTLLRLEDLFEKLFFFIGRGDAREHHVALTLLFDILDVTARADVRSDLAQDLEKQRQSLAGLREHPGVDQDLLATMLGHIEQAIAALTVATGKPGQALRDHDWLNSIRSRLAIPGGVCEFDLPSYHAWRHKPAELREKDFIEWTSSLLPLRHGLAIALKLLRESGQRVDALAQQGNFRRPLDGKGYLLMRVYIDPQLGVFPEISANKYMASIRFFSQDGAMRPQPVSHDVPFQFALCANP
ncbi:cell division protein ZapD [Pigmentiphaga aceris]|uniref:Cell division protein ZapD n=1 Tax=Pigmentiphaga aceris TaxID=1940612 RepID=A0A5C0B190_9BURK|nr:cell division protein ZapD [Pigmentiphaga aceris]QEI08438.1 cell division protein ZapD [Pigmentiphaga aceris]